MIIHRELLSLTGRVNDHSLLCSDKNNNGRSPSAPSNPQYFLWIASSEGGMDITFARSLYTPKITVFPCYLFSW